MPSILKSIRAVGFKSFADQIVVPIRSSMCAIVGPNGCGKSNIIDAVRWVIGESSAKQLRGKSMADVIFNGSTRRKPMGCAEVELLFDNQDGFIGGEYSKYAELSIRRKVERDGQSNYYINNSSCRRRDVLDIFMGTGLGPRSYAIIEQGMVSKLVDARPDDLRVFIEEAAGVSKYKERRRETENRIKHTRENLERVDDLIDELQRQKRSLSRQASAAETYQSLNNENKTKSAQLKAMQWQKFSLQTQDFASYQQSALTELESHKAIVVSCDTDLERLQEGSREDQLHYQEIQKNYFATGSEVARLEQKLQHQQEQKEQWLQEADSDRIRINDLQQHTEEYLQQIAELQEEIDNLSPQQPNLKSKLSEAESNLQRAEQVLQDWQQQWDANQSEFATAQREIQVNKTKIHNSEQQLSQLQIQAQHWKDEQVSSDQLEKVKKDILESEQKAAAVAEEVYEAESKLSASQEQIKQQRNLNNNLENTKHQQQQQLQTLQGQYKSLQALQEASLGKDDLKTQKWLQEKNIDSWPRLAEQLRVDKGWELAVETVLKPFLTAICCEDQASVKTLHDITPPNGSQLMFVADPGCDIEKTNNNIGLESLLDKVDSTRSLSSLLQNIYVADNKQQALSVADKLTAYESIITQDGSWIGNSWMQLGQESDPRQGRVERQQKLVSLEQSIAEEKLSLEQLQQKLEIGYDELTNCESYYSQQQHDLAQLQQQLSQYKSETVVLQGHIDEIARNQGKASQQLELCQQQISLQEAQLEDAKVDLEQAKSVLLVEEQRRESLAEGRDQYREALTQAQAEFQYTSKKTDEIEIRLTANQNQQAILQQTVDRERKQLSSLEEHHQQLLDKLAAADDPNEELAESLESLLEQRLQQDKELQAASAKVSEIDLQRENILAQRKKSQRMVEEQQSKLQDSSLQQKEVATRQQTLLEQLHADGHDNIDAILADLPAQANVKQWQQDLEQNTQRISRLGAINLAAIDELAEVEERFTHLSSQHDDLQQALELLEAAIAKIDSESELKFRTTFDAVNSNLQDLFPSVFNGGRAYLELVDQADISSGVIIRAQPPGKRNTTIQMLSGGERALTAISLVFAMFKLNPAPFCILDEVDAPLDDVNVGRYCELIKKMSQETQFLVISHSKITMSVAGQLLGVTMQEPGVSRLVAVDMEQASELVDA